MDADVLGLRFEADHLGERERDDDAALAHEEPFDRRGEPLAQPLRDVRRLLPLGPAGEEALDGALEALAAERLDEVVDGAQLEGGERVRFVRRGEDHLRPMSCLPERLQAVALGQADVEKDEIRPVVIDAGRGFDAVRRGPEEHKPGMGRDEIDQARPGFDLVLDDEAAERLSHSSSSAASERAIATSARKPAGSSVRVESRARSLNSQRSRSARRWWPRPPSPGSGPAGAPSSSTAKRTPPSPRAISIRKLPPLARGATAWRMAFSTRGWRENGGTSAASASSSTRHSTRRRSPRRMRSISKYCFVISSSSPRVTRSRPSAWRARP